MRTLLLTLLLSATAAVAVAPGYVKQFNLTNTKTHSWQTTFDATTPGHIWLFIRPTFVSADDTFPLYLHLGTVEGLPGTKYRLTLRDVTLGEDIFTNWETTAGRTALLRVKAHVSPHHNYTLKIECPGSTTVKSWLGQTLYRPRLWIHCGVCGKATQFDREIIHPY